MTARRAVLALALLAGCPAAPIAEPQTMPTGKRWQPNRLLQFDYLIWTGGDAPETVWIDASGKELGRASGVVVALRGTVFTLRPDGDAFEAGRVDADSFLPARWDLLPPDRYMWASVQTVRGCPKHCSFCSVWRTDGQKPRQRRIQSPQAPG